MRASPGNFNLSALRSVLDDNAPNVRARILTVYALLAGINVGAWALALAAFHAHPALLATALLAYTFGLRHAVDADHISAIDNVTRKLMHEGKRPVATGLYFSLGHSTIVITLCAAIALAANTVQRALPALQTVGGSIGTAISVMFLYAIAAINLVVLWQVVATFSAVRNGRQLQQQSPGEVLVQPGIMGRLLRPLLSLIGHSSQMYPLGLLFGLGFDTATEVALLGIAALEASRGMPVLTIMIFPVLFTAGMSLIDATDGILMLGAYGWAFVDPARKLYYNVSVTLVSVVVALAIGTVEALSVFSARFQFNLGILGILIVGVFLASWGLSVIAYKSRKFDARPASSGVKSPEAPARANS